MKIFLNSEPEECNEFRFIILTGLLVKMLAWAIQVH